VEREELERLVAQVEAAEATVADFEARLGDPAVYARGGDTVKKILHDLAEAKASVERLTARWEELESLRA
jgi:ATP-binding cassette subfamily F protein uup